MTSLREFARLINEADGTNTHHATAKRRLEFLGASVDDLKSPAKVQHLLKMCTEPPCIWTMYDSLMVRALKSEKDVAELKETVNLLTVESADQARTIAKMTEESSQFKLTIEYQEEVIASLQQDVNEATNRIQQLEAECERLRARIDQLEKNQGDYIYKDDPSYVEED